jgi:signal transduction histidine kinase
MRLRAEALGGRVAVEPRPGGGTRVQLALPVAAAPAGVNP